MKQVHCSNLATHHLGVRARVVNHASRLIRSGTSSRRRSLVAAALLAACGSTVAIAAVTPISVLAPTMISAQTGTAPAWEIGLGDKVPTGIGATAVRGRMPSFYERDVTSVLVFFNTRDAISRQALPKLDSIAQRFGKEVAAVAITDEPVSTLREFTEQPEWSPTLRFTLAADPNRQAFRAFFGPQRAPNLPIAYVMRGGVVQWVGMPIDLDPVVVEVIAGRWDLATARRAAAQMQVWDAMMRDVDALAHSGAVDEALQKLDLACESAMASQKAQCPAHRFTLLLSAKRVRDALAVAEQIIAKPDNDKQAAGIAWTLINQVPGDAEALAFALKAAQGSDRALRGRDAMVGAILARAYFLADRRTEAIETARRALGFADGPEMAKALRDDLQVYEGMGKPGGGATGGAAPKQ